MKRINLKSKNLSPNQRRLKLQELSGIPYESKTSEYNEGYRQWIYYERNYGNEKVFTIYDSESKENKK